MLCECLVEVVEVVVEWFEEGVVFEVFMGSVIDGLKFVLSIMFFEVVVLFLIVCEVILEFFCVLVVCKWVFVVMEF